MEMWLNPQHFDGTLCMWGIPPLWAGEL